MITWSLVSDSERRMKILDYVMEKSLDKESKITKSDIMKYLKDSRPMTTHKITIELIKEGKIKMVKPSDKPYSQIDYLIINEQDKFIKIYKSLSEIENVLDEIRDPVEYICQYSMGEPYPDPTKSKRCYQEKAEFFGELRRACLEPIERLLDFLFIQSNKVIQSEKDSQLVNEKIMDLNLKLMEVFYFKNVFDNINSYLEYDISYLDSLLKDARFHKYTNETEISTDLINNFLGKIKEFSKQFLNDTDKKIEEPHKKSD